MNVYDFDKTIYKKDSSLEFYFFCLKKQPKIIKVLPKQLMGFIKYIFKICSIEEFKSNFFSFFKLINVEKQVHEFWKQEKNNINDWYLKKRKDTDVIISASPDIILKPICDSLKVNLICTNVKISGELIGKNCKSEQKVERFIKDYKDEGIDEFYSDSKSDIYMAEMAQKAYMVKGERIILWKQKS